MGLVEEGIADYPKDSATLIQHYGERAIQCCIDSWNQLYSQYPLSNLTEVLRRKKRLFYSSDVTVLEQGETPGRISRISFGINKRLTARALRRDGDSLLIAVNYRIWWNCEGDQVRGWSDHIMVDVTKDCVTQFPEITPATAHFHCCPLP